jgi:hypothetical protein
MDDSVRGRKRYLSFDVAARARFSRELDAGRGQQLLDRAPRAY